MIRFPLVSLRLFLACLCLLTSACHQAQRDETEKRDIILVTFSGLSFHELHSLPSLVAFASDPESRLSRGISASSDPVPSQAAIWTGARPFDLGFTCHPRQELLDTEAPTLAELLSDLGYRTVGLYSHSFLQPGSGFERGFESYGPLPSQDLAELMDDSESPIFLWVGLPGPRPVDLSGRRSTQFHVKAADQAFEALRSRILDRKKGGNKLVVVTSDTGSSDQGQATSLARHELEVPLILHADSTLLTSVQDEVVATPRIFSTLMEFAGGSLLPGYPDTLSQSSSQGILSELYCQDGHHLVSYLTSGVRLLLDNDLASSAGRRRSPLPPLSSPAKAEHFRLESWSSPETRELDDRELALSLAQELDESWQILQEWELSPERRAARRTALTLPPTP